MLSNFSYRQAHQIDDLEFLGKFRDLVGELWVINRALERVADEDQSLEIR